MWAGGVWGGVEGRWGGTGGGKGASVNGRRIPRLASCRIIGPISIFCYKRLLIIDDEDEINQFRSGL
jgi:hypothetical protein